MKKSLLLLCMLIQTALYAQSPIIDEWTLNTTNKTSSYWLTGSGMPPSYTYTTSTSLADVLKVCYDDNYVYINCNGMTNDMGKYLNPGSCVAQDYVYRFPKTPTVPTTKTISSKGGAIGALINGIPIYGLSNSYSYKNSTSANTNMGGDGIWNVEVYLSEGFVLDTAFGAHPQQQGAYHSHATPWRLYKNSASTVHSPLVGFAFDGNPVYGPYGYSSPLDATSAVARMKTGYSLRNITVRQTLPNGGATLTASQYGPAVNGTYPLGTYCEDYEWLASNNGDLDQYNGRFCKTPEYPSGTYAYFVTMSSASVPQFPYYVGIYYYGTPDPKSILAVSGLTMPTTGVTCVGEATTAVENVEVQSSFSIHPNPANGSFVIDLSSSTPTGAELNIYNLRGEKIYTTIISAATTMVDLPNVTTGIYLVQLRDQNGQTKEVKKLVIR